MEINIMATTKDRAAFTLSREVKAQLEETVPRHSRSQFVENAIAAALLAEAKQRALQALADAPQAETSRDDSVAILRRIRSERDRGLITRHQA